jgi:hypothetical protein
MYSNAGIKKIILWLILIGIMLGFLFFLSPMRIGPVKKMRGVVMLEYMGLIKDPRSNTELRLALKSPDEVEQFNAVSAIAYREYTAENAAALLEYIKSGRGTRRVNNIAVWALGELHAHEAKEYLQTLIGNDNFDQYEVTKAIKKIKGEIPKPFWR